LGCFERGEDSLNEPNPIKAVFRQPFPTLPGNNQVERSAKLVILNKAEAKGYFEPPVSPPVLGDKIFGIEGHPQTPGKGAAPPLQSLLTGGEGKAGGY